MAEIRDFQAAGQRHVFLPATGSIFALDGCAAAVIAAVGAACLARTDNSPPDRSFVSREEVHRALAANYGPEQIGSAITELQAIGCLESAAWGPGRIGTGAREPRVPPVPFPLRTLVLNVAGDCNLACSYCFVRRNGPSSSPRWMDEATARRSVDFLLENSAQSQSVTIVLFGGEPLMNFSLIRAVVPYAREAASRTGKRIDFTLTTNASYLTAEVIGFLAANGIGVSVSIDGPGPYHDLRRTLKNGNGTYALIEPRVKELLRRHRSRPVAARATLSRGHTAVRQSFTHLKQMGFHEVGFAPATSGPDDDYGLTAEELAQVMGEFRTLAAEYVEKALRNEYLGFSNLSNVLSQLHSGFTKAYPCGAGLGLLAVDAAGDLYLCHRFVAQADCKMGNIVAGVDRHKQADFLRRAHLAEKPACQSCWVRHICSGGCHHEAFVRQGALHQPNSHYCDWIRDWVQLGLQAYTEISAHRPEFFSQFIEKRGQ